MFSFKAVSTTLLKAAGASQLTDGVDFFSDTTSISGLSSLCRLGGAGVVLFGMRQLLEEELGTMAGDEVYILDPRPLPGLKFQLARPLPLEA